MKILTAIKRRAAALAIICLASAFVGTQSPVPVGHTEITKWQFGKNAAVSLTYDDSSINQFTQALPIMDRLNIPATFYIITGNIKGSKYQGKFIGRPVQTIINETATIPTNKDNILERASAVGYLGYEGTLAFHKQVGAMYDGGRFEEAFKYMDETYQKIRSGEIKKGPSVNEWLADTRGISWDDIRKFASRGHEFGSHMVTHPRLAALDEVNMLYELEKSREDILRELGPKHIFSAEGPFGTENERVMEYAHKIYPALRNRMPEPYLEELNRSNRMNPGTSKKEYVQWQRGATTKTSMPLVKSWVDTVINHGNNWLVLVIHGVDGIGYEALSHEFLDEYFQYMKSKEDKLWVATFADATKYMRQRMSARVAAAEKDGKMLVTLSHSLDRKMYDLPLTLKTYIKPAWGSVQVKQGAKVHQVNAQKDGKGTFVMYQVLPNSGQVELSGV